MLEIQRGDVDCVVACSERQDGKSALLGRIRRIGKEPSNIDVRLKYYETEHKI